METTDTSIESKAPAPVGSNAATTAKPVVFIVHASVGSGHRSAAEAIAEAMRLLISEHAENFPEDLEVEVVDILQWGRYQFDGDKTASMFVGFTRPVYDIMWRYSFTGRFIWGGGDIWSHLMYEPFTEYVRQRKPIAVIATHIVGANATVAARMLTGQEFPLVCVPTDYETEGLWPHSYTDLFCIATESMVDTLHARHVNDERILLTGIPTREQFRIPHDKRAMRERFGLPQDTRIALALAGAHLPRPYLHLRETLDQVLAQADELNDIHLIVVCGADEEYRKHVNEEVRRYALSNVTVLGYVSDMAELMAASDLIICKSGGLTVTECLCAQIPMILVGEAYGQEKINMETLTAAGAAMHVINARELTDMLRYVTHNPQTLVEMLENGQSLRHPNAARDVAVATMKLVARDCPAKGAWRKKNFVKCTIGDKPAHIR